MRFREIKMGITSHGMFVMFIAAFMLLAAMNYSNNAAYCIFFSVICISFVSCLYGLKNLLGIRIRLAGRAYAFAGSELSARLSISSENTDAIHFLECSLAGVPLSEKSRIIDTLPAHSSLIHELAIPAPERGLRHFKTIKIHSYYPLGFFSFEKEYPINLKCYVYPKLESVLPWPELNNELEDDNDEGSSLLGDSFAGHRPYQLGDSQRHIDWKADSRGKGLWIKEYRGGAAEEIRFDYHTLKTSDVETRLSQLAAWIVQAHAENREYAVHLLDQIFPANRGESHYRTIMEALALFPKSKAES